MPFVMPELILESVVRDGLENVRRDPSLLDDVFGNLTRAFASEKYGTTEIEKIKTAIVEREVSVVHSLSHVNSGLQTDGKTLMISFNLGEESEDESKAGMGDHFATMDVAFKTPSKIAAVTKVAAFTPTAYNAKTGIVTIPDAVNLAPVHVNLLFVDASGTEFNINGSINNTTGSKTIGIDKGVEVDLGPGAEIKSSITFDRYQVKSNIDKTTILLGCHSKEPLLTKYLYTLVKYFLLSRKKDLISRDFQLSTYRGSDFQRNENYTADHVFSRWLTISGMIQHDWNNEKVDLIDNVEVNLTILDC